MKNFLCVFSILLIFLISPYNVNAHSGRTDSNGGHWDRKAGTYHYHNGNSAGRNQPSYSSELNTNQYTHIPYVAPVSKSKLELEIDKLKALVSLYKEKSEKSVEQQNYLITQISKLKKTIAKLELENKELIDDNSHLKQQNMDFYDSIILLENKLTKTITNFQIVVSAILLLVIITAITATIIVTKKYKSLALTKKHNEASYCRQINFLKSKINELLPTPTPNQKHLKQNYDIFKDEDEE